jgi:putative SOS response-associated peptidase YedK
LRCPGCGSALFQISGPTPNFAPHYNAAPGQELPVIRLHPDSGERVLGTLRWGLIPHFSKAPKIAWKCINARGETVKTTPAFRDWRECCEWSSSWGWVILIQWL